MAVPEHIRRVPRPVNTIVEDNGREGPNRYAVRARAGVKYVPGGNPQPRNGRTIGHIIDGVYVPIHKEEAREDAPKKEETKTADSGPDMLSWGASAFVRSVTRDMLGELLQVYPAKDAFTIMAIATLRVIKPSISARRLSTHYKRSFVCKDYPGLALSPNSVCTFLQKLGQDGDRRRRFYQKRSLAVAADHHIAVDGMLKQDSSDVNDLSAFSYKAKERGHRDVSVLYAYDIEAMEPVCAEVFPGNSIDANSYRAFILNNDIKKGIIISDKGFPPSMIKDELRHRPDLHFLTPIRRSDTRIAHNNMLSFEGVLEGLGEQILYKKSAIKGGRFLYSFKSMRKASGEEAGYLARREKNRDFSAEEYEEKRKSFGVIVFESDQDLDPKTVYRCYDDRWLLELVFKRYKSDECLDKTRVQGDFSVIGSEFINFISTVATCRLLRKARAANLLEHMSYGDLMEDLSSAWRMVDAPEKPSSDDGGWVHTLPSVLNELEALGLSTPAPQHPIPIKRGRQKKEPEPEKPKRPRGRPKKNPTL